jgi:hypothetical protein
VDIVRFHQRRNLLHHFLIDNGLVKQTCLLNYGCRFRHPSQELFWLRYAGLAFGRPTWLQQ